MMKKSYQKKSIRKPGWMNRRLLLLLITLLVLTLSIGWGESFDKISAYQKTSDAPKSEYSAFIEVHKNFQNGEIGLGEFKTFDQTNRVIIGGVMVILIIICTVLYGYFFNR
jgi:hypothetical protein